MFRCRGRALLQRQQCNSSPRGTIYSRTVASLPVHTLLNRSTCGAGVARSAWAPKWVVSQGLRAVSTVGRGYRNRGTSEEVHSQESLSDDSLNGPESASDGNVDVPGTMCPDWPVKGEPPEDASPGQHSPDTLGFPRSQKSQDSQVLAYPEQGQAHLPTREVTKPISNPLFEPSTQMLANQERQQQDPGSKNGLNNKFKQFDGAGAHDAPSTNPQQPFSKDPPRYRLWPRNPWRSKTKNGPDLQEATKSIEPNSHPSEFQTPNVRLVNSTVRNENDLVHDGSQTFVPVQGGDKPIQLSSLDEALFDFFTQLEFIVTQKASGHEILAHFESTPWLNEEIASLFGEEELDLLDRVVDAVAEDEFGASSFRTSPETTTSRFVTIKCLALYRRLGLCRPHHWAAGLVKATVAISSYKRATPPASTEENFKWALVLYIKSSSLFALWQAFLVEHNPPHVNVTALGQSQNYEQNGVPRGRNLQDAVFDQVPLWPRAGDPALDQSILGAFVLTVAFCSDLTATTAMRRIPKDTLGSVASHEQPQQPGAASSTDTEITGHPSEPETGKWAVAGVMARAIAPVTLNTTWARLLLAKLSVPGDHAAAILSDVARVIDATCQGMAMGSMQDKLLRPSTDALIAWLDTATSDDSKAFRDWLLRGQWPTERILPAGIRRRLFYALFASYLRHNHLLEARELLRLRRGRLFTRAARSALLRRLYYQRDSLQFDGFWSELNKLPESGWWESTPRVWWYYRLRFAWKEGPTEAFEHLYALSRDGGVTEKTYTRLRSFLVLMASRDMKKKFRSKVEVADANVSKSPKGADAMKDVCMMALRHSICTGNFEDTAFWLKRYRDQFDDDKEKLYSASRLVFRCGIMRREHLSRERIASLFMVAIPLRDRWLDGPILGVLRRKLTGASRPERWRLDLLMTEVAQAGKLFLDMVQKGQRTDKMQVVRALRGFLLRLPLKTSHAHPATEVSRLVSRTTAILVHGRRALKAQQDAHHKRPLSPRLSLEGTQRSRHKEDSKRCRWYPSTLRSNDVQRHTRTKRLPVYEDASFRQKDPLSHKANARGRTYRT